MVLQSIIFSFSNFYNRHDYYSLIYKTCVCSVPPYTHKLRAPLTTTLGYPKNMQCNFNSCSFNYKSDYSRCLIVILADIFGIDNNIQIQCAKKVTNSKFTQVFLQCKIHKNMHHIIIFEGMII